jgi:group I intron endonuclease
VIKIEDLKYTIYVHISPHNKYYVGITSQDINRRWQNGYGYRNQKLFYRAIEKYGWNNFQHEIIATNITEEEAKNFEIILIRELKSSDKKYGYNLSLGGESSNGYKHTDEVKEICRLASKKRVVTEETKRKLSLANKNQKISEEHLEKLQEGKRKYIEENGCGYWKGKNRSQESIQKGSEARRGKCYRQEYHWSESTREKLSKKVYKIDIETNRIIEKWDSIKSTGYGSTHIIDVCKNRRVTAYGYKWAYINPSNPLNIGDIYVDQQQGA